MPHRVCSDCLLDIHSSIAVEVCVGAKAGEVVDQVESFPWPPTVDQLEGKVGQLHFGLPLTSF